MAKEEYSEKIQMLMSNPKNIRNIGIVSHIHHGSRQFFCCEWKKTTLTDNLAAAAGLMAKELVGERMLTWVDERLLSP